MKKIAAVFVSIGVILVIVGLVLVGIFGADALKNFSWSNLFGVGEHDLSLANKFEEIDDLQDVTQIKIETDNFSVYVLPSDGEVISVGYVDKLEGDANIAVNLVGDTLNITETDTLTSFTIFNGFKSNRFIAVYVPQTEQFAGLSLNIKTDVARVSVKNVTFANVDCFAETGGIILRDGNFADVSIETETGAASVEGVTCNSLTVKTNTGAVNVYDSTASNQVKIYVNTGAVNFNSVTDSLDICTDTGSVNFTSGASNIVIETDTGSVNGTVLGNKADYQIKVKKDTGSSNLHNQDVTNATKFLTVKVDTGSIRVRFENAAK